MVFLIAVAAMAIFVASPFGAAVRGTRDQPRRMTALGYNVWLTRFLAFLFSGFWSGVAGLLYLYYNQFVSPQTVALSASAEALLMVIAGGTATLLGPIAGAVLVIIMKDVASAYIERWNFVLGAIFVVIVIFMPEGLVPGSVRLWRWAIAHCCGRKRAGASPRERAMIALEVRDLNKAFGGLRVTSAVNLAVEPGERRLIIGPNGAGKTTLFNLITGELRADSGRIMLFGRDLTGVAARRRAHLGLARTYQIITLFPGETLVRNVTLSLLGLSPLRWNPIVRLNGSAICWTGRARRWRVSDSTILPIGRSRQTSYGERRRVEIAMALAQSPKVLLLDEPFAGLSVEERRDVLALIGDIPRDVTIVMIEHDMDVALEFAERITVLHFGQVIVEGTRAEVVQHPRTREIYLGE